MASAGGRPNGPSDVDIIVAVLTERLESIEQKLTRVLDYIDVHQGRIAGLESRLTGVETSSEWAKRAIEENRRGIDYNLKRSNSQDVFVGLLGVVIQFLINIRS